MNTPTLSPVILRHPFRALLLTAFWFGVIWLILGSFITFIPGGEESWFTLAGVFLAAGLLIRSWFYRVTSVVLVMVCASAAISGHHHGIEYRRHVQEIRSSVSNP
jgi:hypothetical protein